jgi:hypothetical protein
LLEAVEELRGQCGDPKPRFVLFFAGTRYDPQALSAALQSAFAGSTVAGGSTAGEIAAGKMMTGAVATMFFPQDVVEDAAVAVIEDVRSHTSGGSACSQLARYFQAPVASLDLKRHVGLVLVDGLSGAEERLMEKIGDCSDLLFVGGAAGDDLKFDKTYVCSGGKAYTNAAVVIVLRLKNGFEILKTQSFVLSGRRLTATRVNEEQRKVLEFDGRAAVHAYADAIGVPPGEVAARFLDHPLGLMVNGEPFVRSPQRVDGESILFYCQIKEGMRLEVLTGTDIVADTKAALAAARSRLGHIAGLIDFHCILRTLDLRQQGRCDQYGEIFAGLPAIGFSTYGEEYLGHMNQTSTMLLFR